MTVWSGDWFLVQTAHPSNKCSWNNTTVVLPLHEFYCFMIWNVTFWFEFKKRLGNSMETGNYAERNSTHTQGVLCCMSNVLGANSSSDVTSAGQLPLWFNCHEIWYTSFILPSGLTPRACSSSKKKFRLWILLYWIDILAQISFCIVIGSIFSTWCLSAPLWDKKTRTAVLTCWATITWHLSQMKYPCYHVWV